MSPHTDAFKDPPPVKRRNGAGDKVTLNGTAPCHVIKSHRLSATLARQYMGPVPCCPRAHGRHGGALPDSPRETGAGVLLQEGRLGPRRSGWLRSGVHRLLGEEPITCSRGPGPRGTCDADPDRM